MSQPPFLKLMYTRNGISREPTDIWQPSMLLHYMDIYFIAVLIEKTGYLLGLSFPKTKLQ